MRMGRWLACGAIALGLMALRPQALPLTRLADLGSADVFNVAQGPRGSVFYTTPAGVMRYDARSARSELVEPGISTDVAVSPTGDRLAFSRGENDLFVWTVRIDPASGRKAGVARRISVRAGRSAAFSPDGKWIAFSVIPPADTPAPRIVAVPVTGGPERVLAHEEGWAQSLRWSPDGKWIYYRHGTRAAPTRTRTVRRVPAQGGRSQVVAIADEFVGLSPDGRRLAYLAVPSRVSAHQILVIADAAGAEIGRLTLPRDLNVMNWGSGNQLIALRVHLPTSLGFVSSAGQLLDLAASAGSVSAPRFSPDARQIAFRIRVGELDQFAIMDVKTGTQRTVRTVAQPGLRGAMWSGDARRLAFYSDQGRSLHVVELDTGAERKVDECDAQIPVADWSRSRSALVYLCPRAEAYEVRAYHSSGERTLLRRVTLERHDQLSFLLTDEALLAMRADRLVRIDLATGALRELHVLSAEERVTSAIALSADRRWVAFTKAGPGKQSTAEVIQLVSLADGTQRTMAGPRLVHGGVLTWEPLGRYLGLVGESAEGRRDVWLTPLNGDAPFALTRSETRAISSFDFAPDGGGVVYDAAGRQAVSLWQFDLSTRLSGNQAPRR